MLTGRHQQEQFRFDRVLLDAPEGNWVPSSIRMVGNAPVGDNVRLLQQGAADTVAPSPPQPASPEPEPAQAGLFSFLTPVKAEKPVVVEGPLFPSDHFGLYAVFERTNE